LIQARNLRKRIGAVTAVNDLSFEARDGAITGLLGANGAGKTTTLRMICGALQPDSGSIHIDDASSSGDAIELQRRVGALLDHTGLYSRLTARENIEYFGQLRGLRGGRLRDQTDRTISRLGLEAAADRRTFGFSQGERMKVALGRAIVHSPGNLLLDEPTNGLDVPTVRSLRSLLKEMRESGMCIVLSSHVLDEVRALCDVVVVIAKGRSVAHGDPEELCRQAGAASLEDAFMSLTQTEAIECRPN
jgi:sodium transport system ATP-binding protein